MRTPHVLSGGRYPVLRSLAIIYIVGAALAAVSTVIGVGYVLFGTSFAWSDRAIMSLGVLTAGFFLVVSMLAIAEVLKLFIDVEHNTRVSAPGRIGMPAEGSMMTVTIAEGDGAAAEPGRINRLDALDEETAEAALLRGH